MTAGVLSTTRRDCNGGFLVWTIETVLLTSQIPVWAVGRRSTLDLRRHWSNSIKSSYTPDELRAILERSRLTGWRVKEDFMALMIVKEV
jgi:hypothetical protein